MIEGTPQTPLDPQAIAHFIAVQSVVGEFIARRLRKLPCEAFRALITELARISIPDAVAICRRRYAAQNVQSTPEEVLP